MDGNSCGGKTSEKDDEPVEEVKPIQSPEEVTNFILRESGPPRLSPQEEPKGVSQRPISDNCGSSFDTSGPSLSFQSPTTEESEIDNDVDIGKESPDEENENSNADDNQHCLPIATDVPVQSEPRRNSIGPPPSYSFVMKEKRKGQTTSTADVVVERPPPPSYAGIRGLYQPPPEPSTEDEDSNRLCLLPSFSEPVWRSHSQPAFCPRCGILVLTTTHAHESVATHVAALALCMFGCWPCCFLPYCMNVCKNTYHHCPVCQGYLGAYTPW